MIHLIRFGSGNISMNVKISENADAVFMRLPRLQINCLFLFTPLIILLLVFAILSGFFLLDSIYLHLENGSSELYTSL